MKSALLACLSAVVLTSASADAAVLLFINNQAGFNTAVTSKVLNGTENWASAGNAVGALIADPLVSGVAKGPFPNNSALAATGISIQSNTGGASSAFVAPRGTGGLYYAPTGFVGFSGTAQPSNQVSTGIAGDSMDVLMGLAHVQAVSLSAMYYKNIGPTSPAIGNVTVSVYDKSGNLLTSGTVNNVGDVQENGFFGVVATNGEEIGRINVFAGTNAFSGADNITVYSVPEVSALSLAGIAALGLLRRRRD